MSVSKFYILRSRFQPFTRYHYDAIASLILDKREEFQNEQAVIVLAVIRDYETLLRSYDPKIDLNMDDIDFRHLPLFNPLCFNDIVLDIKEGNKVYLREKYPDPDIKDPEKTLLTEILYHRMVIVPLYVKFRDLLALLQNPEAIPDDIKKTFPDTSEELGKFLLNKVRDIFSYVPGGVKPSLTWCIPIFDIEDCRDITEATKIAPEEYIPILFDNNIPSLEIPGLTVGELGVYGVFASYAIARLQKETGVDRFFNNDDIAAMDDTIRAWAPKPTVERFKARLDTRVAEIKTNALRSGEKKFYLGGKRQIERYFGALMLAATPSSYKPKKEVVTINVGSALSIQHEFMTYLRKLLGQKAMIDVANKEVKPKETAVRECTEALLQLVEFASGRSEPSSRVSDDQLKAVKDLAGCESPNDVRASALIIGKDTISGIQKLWR